MIKLRNIKRNDSQISCDAFVEDCEIPIQLVYDEEKSEFEDYILPGEYSYCIAHIAQARRFMETLIGKEITETEKTIMWC